MPLYRRVPKRGFNNIFAKVYSVVNVSDLNVFDDGSVGDESSLREKGLENKVIDGVKILGDGALKKKLTVKATKFTKTASEKIEAAGGKVEVI